MRAGQGLKWTATYQSPVLGGLSWVVDLWIPLAKILRFTAGTMQCCFQK